MRSAVAVGVIGLLLVVDVGSTYGQRLATRRSLDPPRVKPPFRGGQLRATIMPVLPSPLMPSGNPGGAADDALFDQALQEQRAGNPKQARKGFYQLIKHHPMSRHIPSVYLSFADYFFNQGSLANAQRFYQRVLRGHPTYPHADYVRVKLAVIKLNLGQHAAALQEFYKLFRKPLTGLLRQASEHGLVLSYSHVGRRQKAYAFFQRINRAAALPLLAQLAWRYSAQGKTRKALWTFRQLIKLQPKAPGLCDWQTAVVRNVYAVGRLVRKLRATLNLMRLASRLHRSSPTNARRCMQRAQHIALWRANAWMHESVNRGSKTLLLQMAQRLYAAYGRVFPRGKHRAKASYYRAEALWRLAADAGYQRRNNRQMWLGTSRAFRRAARTRGLSRRLRAEARRAARLASRNAARF